MRSRTTRIASVAVAALASGLAVPAAAPARATTTSVSFVAEGVVDPASPSISDDGRWVVTGGTADDGRRTVYRTDTSNGVTEELSPVPEGIRSGDTVHPLVSADGCVVVATTEIAFDLFRDNDRGDRWDVYRLVVPECGGRPNAWELVSQSAPGGSALDGVPTDGPAAISGSGAIIAFSHQLPGADAGVTTISVVDTRVVPDDPDRIQKIAGMPFEAPNGVHRYRGARQPVLSQNARHLAFVSDTTASSPLPGWGTGPVEGGPATSQVFVWDRGADDQRRAVYLVSGVDGEPSAAGADSPAMSEDGRMIAFRSADRSLVPAVIPDCEGGCPSQIYRFDRDTNNNGVFDEEADTDGLAIVSAVDPDGDDAGVPVAGDAPSRAPAMNADGSQVAFVTDATNLLPTSRGGGGAVDDGDLVVAEMGLGRLRRVLDGPDFATVAGAHGGASLSATGQRIVFGTGATQSIGEAIGVAAEGRAVVAVDVEPRLSLAELDFGSVLVGFESAEMYISVRNAGPAAFAPAEVVSSDNFRITGGTCARGIIVAAGRSCSVEVTFTPTAPEVYTGTVTVTGVGGLEATTEVRGHAGEPTLRATPGGVDLRPGVIGEPGDRVAIDIENISFFPTELASIEISGSEPEDFVVVSQSCLDRFLNPGASCTVEVQIVPTAAGHRSALLVATTTGGQQTSSVLGGFARPKPAIEIEPAPAGGYRAGTDVGVGGTGFPPGEEVVISFGDGTGRLATATATDSGLFLVRFDLPAWVRPGERRLVADSAYGGASAPIVIEVQRAPNRDLVPGFGLG